MQVHRRPVMLSARFWQAEWMTRSGIIHPLPIPRLRLRLHGSVILTSQMPVMRWHEQLGDPTVADGILDRRVHNAHRIEMRGDSMRKNRGKPSV